MNMCTNILVMLGLLVGTAQGMTEASKTQNPVVEEKKQALVVARTGLDLTQTINHELWGTILDYLVRTPHDLLMLVKTNKQFAVFIGITTKDQIGNMGPGLKKLFAVIDEKNGFGSLHRVISFSQPRVLTLWKQYFCQKVKSDIQDQKALTSMGCEELVQTGLQCEYGRENTDGFSPLQCAVRNNNRPMAELLIAQGAPITGDGDKHPLFIALYGLGNLHELPRDEKIEHKIQAYKKLISFLISKDTHFGTHTYRITGNNGDTLVHAAIRTDDENLVDSMLDYFLNLSGDVNGLQFVQETLNNNGENIYDVAASFGQQDIMQLLLNRGIFQLVDNAEDAEEVDHGIEPEHQDNVIQA